HQKEGPPIARNILARLGAREEIIEEVCDIIGHHHHPRDEETLNCKILYDADLIVNLEEQQKKRKADDERLREIIDANMLTDGGKSLARGALLGE
ncbi:MAG: phosphohydrolase, partial [Thermodesulfobacteriota bacterium]|nr:phosphohydrolase [Thermodesulfobacteriota bacterium]